MISQEVLRNPYPFYAELRHNSPLIEIVPGNWLATRYNDVAAIVSSEQSTMSREALSDDFPDDELEHFNDYRLLHTEGELHDKRRWFANESFKPRRIRSLRPALEHDVTAIVADFQDGDDFITKVATPYAGLTMLRIIGIPVADEPEVRKWVGPIIATNDPSSMFDPEVRANALDAWHAARAYLGDLYDRRTADPQDDTLSSLIHTVDKQGRKLDRDEVINLCVSMMPAGHSNSTNALTSAMLALVDNPDQAKILRDQPDVLENTGIEELYRWDAPIQVTARALTGDVTVDGITIPGGSLVWLAFGSANHDETVFEDPDRLDVLRENANKHLTSGMGMHYCLGAAISRVEVISAISAMLREFSDIKLDGDRETIEWNPEVNHRSVTALPLKVTR